ncbi:hypothetical protein [Veillonella sp. CHU740]|uniref:hypothetical protein n=1 Tax=Veillonella sp. CHU740 TaxID=2490950 RepID=UPI000F8EE6FB|nr:hypothetical protein [Veillonella sp. CHU740]
MFNLERLEALKTNALIVRNGLNESVITTSIYTEPTIAQAIAVFTACDALVSNVDDYLTAPEEYGDRNLDLFLQGMHYLFRSIWTDKIGYCSVVLGGCTHGVRGHFGDMTDSLKEQLYYEEA